MSTQRRGWSAIGEAAGARLVDILGYHSKIEPGSKSGTTVLQLSDYTAPPRPPTSYREPFESIDFLNEIGPDFGYQASIFIDAYSVIAIAPGYEHMFITHEIDRDVSATEKMSYLDTADCARLINDFVNPRYDNRIPDTEQRSLTDFE